MFKSGIPSFWHSRQTILPSAEAATVWIIPFLHPEFLTKSNKPRTVNGFSVPHAADCIGTFSSISKVKLTVATAYSAHEPLKEKKLTLFPIQSWSF